MQIQGEPDSMRIQCGRALIQRDRAQSGVSV